jgi:2-hydroxy-6-oxonona-2,4-dienedioate hydrolase
VFQGTEKLRSRWTDALGYRVHARVSPGETGDLKLVLVHGQVVSSRYMIPTAALLAEEYGVYVPDLPGFGESESPDHTLSLAELANVLEAWMAANGIDAAVMIGNSFGCQIIAEHAIRHPGRVRGLVLQSPTVDPAARTAASQIARWLLNALIEPPSMGLVLALDYWQAGFRRSIVNFLGPVLSDEIERKLPRITVPAMVVRGSRDPIVPHRWAEEAARLLPSGCLRTIPGAPHTVNFTAPLEFVRVMRPLLEQVAAEARDLRRTRSPR